MSLAPEKKKTGARHQRRLIAGHQANGRTNGRFYLRSRSLG
jgi:hypothetical protein